MIEHTLIRNGLFFDGKGSPASTKHVLIRDGIVAEVSDREIQAPEGARVIDAQGKWVMPGFIDIHTHYDAEVEAIPSLHESLRHGVTTVFMGSCSLSTAVGDATDIADMFTRVEAIPYEHLLPLIRQRKSWDSHSEYADHLDSLPLGPNVSSFVGYSVINWVPSFMDRSFAIPFVQIGVWLGLIIGISGGAGFFFGGYIADKLGRSAQRRSLIFIAGVTFVSAALLTWTFLANSWQLVLWLFVIPAATMNVYLAPVLAQVQSLVALRMRSVASAIVLLIINIIGLALGPWLTGLLSDGLDATYGQESLRYALLITVATVLPLASLTFWLGGRHIDADLARANDSD